MPKVTIMGAGSAVFSRQLMVDIMLIPGLEAGSFALVDIDPARLELAHQLAEKVIALSGKDWTVEASTERRQVMDDTDYLINFIEVSGLQTVRLDHEIPMKYGIKQCIGDTIGPGGIFKALRTGPDWLDILYDAEDLCPDALALNYTNPMSILTLAALRATDVQVVGLCHSVQGTSEQLAGYASVPYEEMQWRCAGINHNAWFTELTHHGQDLYPLLKERAQEPAFFDQDPVRFEVMRQFGYFVTESSGHFSEYVPYFRKRDDLIAKYDRTGYRGETGFYATNWPTWRQAADEYARRMIAGEAEIELRRSHEYASYIIEAVETGVPTRIHGNVLNTGLIDNLPQDGCVEVACMIDANGLNPCHFGYLPPHLAALNQAHMAVHELVATSLLEGDREAAVHALMLDPLTAAVCSLEEIRSLFNEMYEAEREFIRIF
jgi:alpha-galactosidase